jgi:hypothetical protein
MDGGVSDFQPLIDEDTITVSPFYFHRADIKVCIYVYVYVAGGLQGSGCTTLLPAQLRIDHLYGAQIQSVSQTAV